MAITASLNLKSRLIRDFLELRLTTNAHAAMPHISMTRKVAMLVWMADNPDGTLREAQARDHDQNPTCHPMSITFLGVLRRAPDSSIFCAGIPRTNEVRPACPVCAAQYPSPAHRPHPWPPTSAATCSAARAHVPTWARVRALPACAAR